MTPALAAALALAPAVMPAWPGAPRPARVRAWAYAPGLPPEGLASLAPKPGRFAFQPAAADPPLEIAFLANARPVRVRATVLLAGRSAAADWRAQTDRLFAAFDRDGSGGLNRTEYDQIVSLKGVRTLLGGNFHTPIGENPPDFAAVDLDGDDRISPDELAALYAPAADDVLTPRFVPVQNENQNRLTTELFKILDADGDGRLTRAEMAAVAASLTSKDRDDDECLGVTEILPTFYDGRNTGRPAEPRPSETGDPLLRVHRGELPGTLIQDLLAKYDADRDGFCTPKEIGFAPPAFSRLDANADGKLSPKELDAWRVGDPEYTAVLDLHADAKACRAELTPAPPDAPTTPGRVTLRVGSQFLDLSATPPRDVAVQFQIQEQLRETYPQDKPKVTEADIAGPQYQFLRIVFDAADRNGDGTLTRDEYRQYLTAQQSTINAAVAAAFAVRTPGLFQMIDANADGRLSVRELRTAYDRLKPLDPDPGPGVTAKALQPAGGVRLGRAAYIAQDPQAQGNPFERGRVPAKGPIWFVRMDRNGDGDLSRGEFLGEAATFTAIDADGDGLISPQEAEAFDLKVRTMK